MIELTEKEKKARERVCLALDVSTVREGLEMARELSDYVGTVKLNSLFTAAMDEGTNIIEAIHDEEGSVFLDLKYHDTPNTVRNYGRAAAVPGVYMFNVHIAGGEEMCRKAIEGAYEGAQARGIERPKVIGVTVLTSLSDEDLAAQGLGIDYDDLVKRRTELAKEWGLDGVVCPASKAGALEQMGYDFIKVTPGIKWAGVQREGQKQLYTPDMAVNDCKNSILVIGGALTKAKDRRGTAYDILRAMGENL